MSTAMVAYIQVNVMVVGVWSRGSLLHLLLRWHNGAPIAAVVYVYGPSDCLDCCIAPGVQIVAMCFDDDVAFLFC